MEKLPMRGSANAKDVRSRRRQREMRIAASIGSEATKGAAPVATTAADNGNSPQQAPQQPVKVSTRNVRPNLPRVENTETAASATPQNAALDANDNADATNEDGNRQNPRRGNSRRGPNRRRPRNPNYKKPENGTENNAEPMDADNYTQPERSADHHDRDRDHDNRSNEASAPQSQPVVVTATPAAVIEAKPVVEAIQIAKPQPVAAPAESAPQPVHRPAAEVAPIIVAPVENRPQPAPVQEAQSTPRPPQDTENN